MINNVQVVYLDGDVLHRDEQGDVFGSSEELQTRKHSESQ